MYISQNIIYDKEAIKTSDYEFHTKQLEIVSLNLDDFNSRLNSNIKLHYNHIWNAFLLESNNEIYGDVFSRHISYCLGFFNDKGLLESSFIQKDLFTIKSVMFNLFFHIRDDFDYFKQSEELKLELHLFLKRFDNNYCPLGILSNEGQIYYKEECKKIVDKIKSILYKLN